MGKMDPANSRLYIINISHLVTMDADRSIVKDAWIEITDGWITAVGSGQDQEAELKGRECKVIDARQGIVLPGLINTHHHFYQNLARAYTPATNLPLLPWLTCITPLFRNLTAEDLLIATKVAMAELMLTGCTTTVDHHYLFPPSNSGFIDAQFAAAGEMGMRFHAGRGSMDTVSKIIPSWATETVDEIMNDCQRLYDRYHDFSRGSMTRLFLAPSALTCASPDLLKESARMASSLDLGLHIHCGETLEEDQYALDHLGSRQLPFLADCGWETERVWLAHGIHFDDAEIAHLGQRGMGIAHCPCSNMRLGSGICRVGDLQKAGAKVGLGVDGSASNDSSHMLNEARQALLLARVKYGAGAMSTMDALELATTGGASCLGRGDDLGSLEVGKCADLAIFPAEDLFSSGADNAVEALLLCFPRQVETLIINGRVRVRDGRITGLDLPELLASHQTIAGRIQE